MTLRPWGLVVYQGAGCIVLGLFAVASDLLAVSDADVPASVTGLGIVLLAVGALSFVPVFKVDDGGVYVRNFLRHHHWKWKEVQAIRLTGRSLLLTRAGRFSELVVDDGLRRVRVAATIAMSRKRASGLLSVLRAHPCVVDSDVEPRQFPTLNGGDALRELGAKATEEWEREQEVYRRLDRERQRRAQGGPSGFA